MKNIAAFYFLNQVGADRIMDKIADVIVVPGVWCKFHMPDCKWVKRAFVGEGKLVTEVIPVALA